MGGCFVHVHLQFHSEFIDEAVVATAGALLLVAAAGGLDSGFQFNSSHSLDFIEKCRGIR